MRRDVSSPGAAEKERIRAEIENHVKQFLQAGGHIDVLSQDAPRDNRNPVSPWRNVDDDLGLAG